MTHEVASQVADFLHWLHQREIEQDDRAVVQRFSAAYERLIRTARSADRATQDSILRALAAGLAAEQSPWEFGSLANTCGVIVEVGGDPNIAIEPILDRITVLFAAVPEIVRVMQEHLGVEHPNRVAEKDWPSLGEAHPEHAGVIGDWHALRLVGCAAMTMLCRDTGARIQARERIDLIQRAESARSDNPFAYYLAELLGMVDNERLLVLDTTRRLGFRMHLTAIRNNFHLFTLLQDALLAHPSAADWRGPRVRPLVVAVAKSERMLPEISPNEWSAEDPTNASVVSDAAIWTYYNAKGLKADGSFHTLAASHGSPPWVWGEMKPTEIPILNGERIVLLGPLEVPRSWYIGFFAPLHPALRSSVHVEGVLRDDEYRAWIAKCV